MSSSTTADTPTASVPQLLPPLQVGDYIAPFNLPSTDEESISLDKFVGKSLLIFFYLKDGAPGCTKEVCGFRDLHDEFDKLGIQILGIGIESAQSHKAFAESNKLPYPLLSGANSDVFARYGVLQEASADGQPALTIRRVSYLVDPSFHVHKNYVDVSSPNHPAEVLEDAKRMLLREEPRQIIQHAPVLLIPNVLPPDLCKELIGLWETENEDSGFMKQVDGKTVGLTDYSHKIRRDHFMKPGELQTQVQKYLAARVIPRMKMAFNYAVTRREDLRVACYDASRGGYFRPHRDNTTDGTAHRRFAMSLLLNDDYEGGFLRFPEYGRHTYRPDAGGAVIFSCSLLHEATDVTAGRRFVLLSFLYGEAEAKMREEYNRRAGGNYRA